MKILGANWKTTVSGFITLLTGAIFVKPALVDFISEPWRSYIIGISNIVVFISGGTFALVAKDWNVTAGNVQQTLSGAKAAEGTQSLVDQTVIATMESREKVTPEQANAVRGLR